MLFFEKNDMGFFLDFFTKIKYHLLKMFLIKNVREGKLQVRLFYKEAQQLVENIKQYEHTVIEIKTENRLNYDLQVIELQRALRKVYEKGFEDGRNSVRKETLL